MTDSQNPGQDRSSSRSYGGGDPSSSMRPSGGPARVEPRSYASSTAAVRTPAGPSSPPDASADSLGRTGTGIGTGTGPGSGASTGGPGSSFVGRLDTSSVGRTFARVGSALTNAASGRPVSPGQVKVRKARLRIARVDPWSVMKVSFVLSIALGIVTLVATAVVWNVLKSLGVFDSLNKTVGDLTSSGNGSSTSSFNLMSYLSFTHVEGYALILVLVDIVLVTALATLGSYLYNLASGFVGGFEVTLAEDQ
ncbi:MAG TPA: DUF3566 domain-containing protein [Actinocrinis sp.]